MMIPTRSFKVIAPSGDAMLELDGIEYDGKLWIVPQWLESNEPPPRRRPARMIRFDDHPHQRAPAGKYLVNSPIPKSVLDGETQGEFETLSGSEIAFSFTFKTH